MPKMRYFQLIADIRDKCEWELKDIDFCSTEDKSESLKTYENKLIEYRDAMTYLLGCQIGMVYSGYAGVKKPSKELLVDCFKDRLEYVNKSYVYCSKSVFMPKKHIKKMIDVCDHYIDILQMDTWYNRLPEYIPTYEEKYAEKLE